MLVSEREKNAERISRTASTVSNTYSGNSSKGKRLYANRKGGNKTEVTGRARCCAALSGGAVALGDTYGRAAGVRAVAFLEAAGEALGVSTIRFC